MSFPVGRRYVVAALLVVGIPLATAHAAWTLKFHVENSTSSSLAEIVSGTAGQLAATTWTAQLPIGYNQDLTAEFVPLLVLARLRDDLASNTDQDSASARSWIAERMGSYANTPTNSIAGNLFATIALITVETSTWCGDDTGIDHRCTGDCISPCGVAGPTACCQCACVGHAVWVD